MKKRLLYYSTSLALLLAAAPCWSANIGDRIDINGFLTVAGTYGDNDGDIRTPDTDTVPYLNDLIGEDFSADIRDTRLGLQISGSVSKRIDLTAQLLARGGTGNFDVEADWAYANFNLTDSLRVRAGKIKFPTFLVSDYIEVGYAYLWARPPEEVYSLNPITTLVGGDVVYAPQIGGVTLLVQPYYGSNSFEAVIPPAGIDAFNASLPPGSPNIPKGTTLDVNAQNLAGINLSVSNEIFTVRAGYLQTDVSSNAPGPFGLDDKRAQFASIGFSVDWRNFIAIGEYAQRDQESELEQAFPDQEAWYTTLGYRVGQVIPHITYAKLEAGDNENPNALPLDQESVTLGLRWDLSDAADFKFEAKQVETAGEGFSENYGLFDSPVEDGMLYTVTVDLIF